MSCSTPLRQAAPLALTLVLFLLLAAAVELRLFVAVDASIGEALRLAQGSPLSRATMTFSLLGQGWALAVTAAVAVLIALGARRVPAALCIGLSAAGAGLANTGLKLLLSRPRPELGLTVASGYSFPSGHAMGAAAVYLAIGLALARQWPAKRRVWLSGAVALILAMGLSRLALGVHFASDVLAGWLLGAGWAVWLDQRCSPRPSS